LHSLWQWFLEPGNQKFLLGGFLAFLVGLSLGVWIRRKRTDAARSMGDRGDAAFLKGFQYILSNDRDQAIEEFTKSVQVNSETIETYVALGNLYRSKGDIERAIRIRQSIILRPHIDEQTKLRALFDLGLDYQKGGFLNRALKAFLQVAQKAPSHVETLEEIEKIYEATKDWENAYQTRQKIAKITKSDYKNVLAHHLVEMAKTLADKGESSQAVSLFNKAISIHRACVDAYLHLGDLFFDKGEYKKAISTWKKVVDVAPQMTFLAYRRLEGAYSKMKNLEPVEDFLKECVQSNPDAFTHMALGRYLYNENDIDGALRQIQTALELAPSLWEARKFRGEILLSHGEEKDALADYRELIGSLDVPYMKFQCSQCGFRANELQWKCPQCRNWDTIHLIDAPDTQSLPMHRPEAPSGLSENKKGR
jgi:lipopolysaccharide biosynthesis regulator YciM